MSQPRPWPSSDSLDAGIGDADNDDITASGLLSTLAKPEVYRAVFKFRKKTEMEQKGYDKTARQAEVAFPTS